MQESEAPASEQQSVAFRINFGVAGDSCGGSPGGDQDAYMNIDVHHEAVQEAVQDAVHGAVHQVLQSQSLPLLISHARVYSMHLIFWSRLSAIGSWELAVHCMLALHPGLYNNSTMMAEPCPCYPQSGGQLQSKRATRPLSACAGG